MTASPPLAHDPTAAGLAAPAPAPPRARRRTGRWVALGLVLALVAAALPMAVRMLRPAPPPDVGTVKATANGRYRVLLAPERGPVPLQRLHRWTVRVDPVGGAPGTSPNGAPGAPPTVTVDGGMPHHGHGLPTRPRVTGRLPDGRLVIDGVRFSMPGWWELRLRVAGGAGTDSVTFNLAL
jgi:hypothetical protein